MANKKTTAKGGRQSSKSESELSMEEIVKKLDRLLENDEKRVNEFRESEERRTKELKEMFELVRQLKEELKKKDDVIQKLQNELADTQQYQRINNLIITGIPHKEREDTDDLVIKLGEQMGVNIEKRDIDISHRLPGNAKNQSPIIVKFVRRIKKIELLKNRRKLRDINSSHVVGGAPNNKVFINEHLTKKNQILFTSARKLREEKLIADTWVRDCKIWVRQAEGMQVKQIINVEDLDVLRLGPGWQRNVRK